MNIQFINKIKQQYKDNHNYYFLYTCLFLILVSITVILMGTYFSANDFISKTLGVWLLILASILIFNYNFVCIFIKKNNEIEQNFINTINKSLYEIHKIKLPCNKLLTNVKFIDDLDAIHINYYNDSDGTERPHYYYEPEYYNEKPLNYGFGGLSGVSFIVWFIAFLVILKFQDGEMSANYLLLPLLLAGIFLYISLLKDTAYKHLQKVINNTNNNMGVIKHELRKLRHELKSRDNL